MEKYSFTVVKSSEEIELEKRLQNKEREVNRMRDKTTDLKLNMNDPQGDHPSFFDGAEKENGDSQNIEKVYQNVHEIKSIITKFGMQSMANHSKTNTMFTDPIRNSGTFGDTGMNPYNSQYMGRIPQGGMTA